MNMSDKRFSRLIAHPYLPLVVLIVLNVIAASFVVVDYGESWDEQLRYDYATKSLAAYFGDVRGSLKDEKGAFYVMLAMLGARAVGVIHRDWLPIESWHFMHFLSFQMSLFFLYML